MHTQTDVTADLLLDQITREKELFGRFADREAGLTKVVQDRDWNNLEKALADLEELAGSIELSEKKRHLHFQELKKQLGVSDRAGFGLVASRLPEARRGPLVAAQRELKAAVARVRSLTGSLAYYFRYVKESVEQILAEVLPHRKGRIYSHSGLAMDGREGPVVLDHSL